MAIIGLDEVVLISLPQKYTFNLHSRFCWILVKCFTIYICFCDEEVLGQNLLVFLSQSAVDWRHSLAPSSSCCQLQLLPAPAAATLLPPPCSPMSPMSLEKCVYVTVMDCLNNQIDRVDMGLPMSIRSCVSVQ